MQRKILFVIAMTLICSVSSRAQTELKVTCDNPTNQSINLAWLHYSENGSGANKVSGTVGDGFATCQPNQSKTTGIKRNGYEQKYPKVGLRLWFDYENRGNGRREKTIFFAPPLEQEKVSQPDEVIITWEGNSPIKATLKYRNGQPDCIMYPQPAAAMPAILHPGGGK